MATKSIRLSDGTDALYPIASNMLARSLSSVDDVCVETVFADIRSAEVVLYQTEQSGELVEIEVEEVEEIETQEKQNEIT